MFTTKKIYLSIALCITFGFLGTALITSSLNNGYMHVYGNNENQYSITLDKNNKITNSSSFIDDIVENEISLDSKSNKVKFKSQGLKSLNDNSWQIFNVGGYFQNIDHIIGMDSITVYGSTGSSKSSASTLDIYYSKDFINPNILSTYDKISLEYPSATKNYKLICDFSAYKPNYIYASIDKSNLLINSAYISINSSCHDFYPLLTIDNKNQLSGTTTGQGTHHQGSDVTLAASPNRGYYFVGWFLENNIVSSETNLKIKMPDYPVSYEARFAPYNHDVTIINDNNKGTVTGAGKYDFNETVTLKAEPNEGYYFYGWYKDSSYVSDSNPYTFVMDNNSETFTCEYRTNSYDLNIVKEKDSYGTISGDGTYYFKEEVTLNATANNGYEFLGWFDGEELKSSLETYTFLMPAKKLNLTAKFGALKYHISLKTLDLSTNEANNGGKVYFENSKLTEMDFDYLTSVTLIAEANTGKHLLGWYDADGVRLSREEKYTFNMGYKDMVITAKFDIEIDVIAIPMPGQEDRGSVTGSGKYAKGDVITISAKPNDEWLFKEWQDDFGNVLSEYTKETFDYEVLDFDAAFYCNFNKYPKQGEFCFLGSYPQSLVKDASLKESLLIKSGRFVNDSWSKYSDYYVHGGERFVVPKNRYKDVFDDNGNKYRAVCLEESYNSYQVGEIYFFKFEPIEWNVLNNRGMIASKYLLDTNQQWYHDHEYNRTIDGKTVYPNNYKYSEIRTWLNTRFLETAFTKNEIDKRIAITDVDNSNLSFDYYKDDVACENTNDKIFMLSHHDVSDPALGFDQYNPCRMLVPTDYSICLGSYTYNGFGYWQLRSPYPKRLNESYYVNFEGKQDYIHAVDSATTSIRPALTLAL